MVIYFITVVYIIYFITVVYIITVIYIIYIITVIYIIDIISIILLDVILGTNEFFNISFILLFVPRKSVFPLILMVRQIVEHEFPH